MLQHSVILVERGSGWRPLRSLGTSLMFKHITVVLYHGSPLPWKRFGDKLSSCYGILTFRYLLFNSGHLHMSMLCALKFWCEIFDPSLTFDLIVYFSPVCSCRSTTINQCYRICCRSLGILKAPLLHSSLSPWRRTTFRKRIWLALKHWTMKLLTWWDYCFLLEFLSFLHNYKSNLRRLFGVRLSFYYVVVTVKLKGLLIQLD